MQVALLGRSPGLANALESFLQEEDPNQVKGRGGADDARKQAWIFQAVAIGFRPGVDNGKGGGVVLGTCFRHGLFTSHARNQGPKQGLVQQGLQTRGPRSWLAREHKLLR